MRRLIESIVIDSPPEPIWHWLTDLAQQYTEWHPDHVLAEWERGEPNRVGSILRAVERLGGAREVLRFELTAIDPPHRFEYRMRGPISLLLPGGAFDVLPHNGTSQFIASISYRFGSLTERLFRRRVAALKHHMAEEGENLKRIIEAAKRVAPESNAGATDRRPSCEPAPHRTRGEPAPGHRHSSNKARCTDSLIAIQRAYPCLPVGTRAAGAGWKATTG